MAENELPNEGDDINQSGSFGVGVNKGNINVYPSENHLTPQEYRNRQALLTKVNNFWVKGVLEKSLHNQVLIELGLEERPDAITNSWNAVLETGENSPQPLPQGTKIIDVFDDIGAGRTLLILGEPGSGKTTTLLELTRDLIALAEQDTKQLIPVVFNLSSWAKKRQKIEYWLTEELGNKYDVLKKIRESLVKEQQLLPLLDGLDEVKAEYRDDCLVAINQFKQDYGSELVVCSRIKDYQDLSNRLNFQSAVCIQLLSREQICNYLDSLGDKLTGLKTLIVQDLVWEELGESPLMLNIMALAYEGIAFEDLPKTGVLEERRQKLFDAYMVKVFKRRKANQLYKNKQAIHWLVWLAKKMVQQSQTIFLIEKIQPNWLLSQSDRVFYIVLNKVLLLLLFILIAGIAFLHFFFESTEKFNPVIFGSHTIVIGIFLWFLFESINLIDQMVDKGFDEIKTIEKISFSWRNIKTIKIIKFLIVYSIAFGLLFFATFETLNIKLVSGRLNGWFTFYPISVLVLVVRSSLGSTQIKDKLIPNQSMWISAQNSIVGGITIGIITTFAFALIQGLDSYTDLLSDLRTSGLTTGVLGGLFFGGKACIQHFSLRLILYFNNYIPCNYAHFLDYAADRILLQKVGGGYIFIHRMLMEHFAEMPLD